VAVTHPPWFDPGMPRREDCVLKAILDDRAARIPDRRLALFEDGTQWTWREGREQARAQAAALQALGVRAGDRVVAWLPNGPALVRAWFAINYLGAVFVPLNTAYRGASLEHTINACRAKLVLAHSALVERFEGLSLEHVERVIVLPQTELTGDPTQLDDSAQPQPWDAQSVIYTSGTTGLSKGVVSP
jgi:crotonobetaine/carnitine-CoA ligase